MQDLPQIVRDRLREPAGAESHPDADLLTAFVEHSLANSERSPVLEHLARCANCREIATLALPATEPVTLPHSAAASRSRWFNLPVLRWGLVAAGILAVVSIGIVQYRRREPQPKIEATKIETTKIETVAPALTARNNTVATSQSLQPSPGSFKTEAVDRATERKQSEVREKSLPNAQDALPTGSAVASARTVPKSYAMGSGSRRSSAGGGSGGGFAPASKDEATVASVARTSPPRPGPQFVLPRSSQVVEVQTENSVVSTAQSQVVDQLIQNQKALPLPGESGTNSDVVKAKAPTLPEAAPNAAPAQTGSYEKTLQPSPQRWTISSSGTLQRSFDAGNTWQDVDLNSVAQVGTSKGGIVGADEKDEKKVPKEMAQPTLVFRAVTVIGPSVWVGGSGATLFHSEDSGAHWTRLLPSSDSRVLNGDIVVIEFSDTQHGRIATSNGELWITADSGKTWILQP